jgi:CDP-diacylglycerol--serine O-phosphatidyltransferase
VIVYVTVRNAWSLSVSQLEWLLAPVLLVPGLFVAMGVVRLGLYTAHDTAEDYTEGVQTTLAATILAAAVLSGITDPRVLLGATGAFAVLMVVDVTYPDLYARDALAMGGLQALAVLVPTALGGAFPRILLGAALAYLLLAPRFYWREIRESADATDSDATDSDLTDGDDPERLDAEGSDPGTSHGD